LTSVRIAHSESDIRIYSSNSAVIRIEPQTLCHVAYHANSVWNRIEIYAKDCSRQSWYKGSRAYRSGDSSCRVDRVDAASAAKPKENPCCSAVVYADKRFALLQACYDNRRSY